MRDLKLAHILVETLSAGILQVLRLYGSQF